MKKKVLFFGIVIIIITITIIIIFFQYEEKSYPIKDNYIYNLESTSIYNTLKNCIRKYYYSCYNIQNGNDNTKLEEIKKIYLLLDEKYKKEYDIKIEKIEEIVKKEKYTQVDIILNKVLFVKHNDIYSYFIYGDLRDLISNEYKNINFIICFDTKNETYSIFLEDYINDNKYDNIKKGDSIEWNFSNAICYNEKNKFEYLEYIQDEYVYDIYNDIRNYILYYPEKAYKLLNNKINFYNYNKFNDFITKNRKEIFIMDLASYSSEYKNGENIYICRDSKNKFELKIYSRYPGDMAFDITKIE